MHVPAKLFSDSSDKELNLPIFILLKFANRRLLLIKSRLTTALFFSVWLLLLAGVIYLIWAEDQQQPREGKPIATLKLAQGQVQSRMEEVVVWSNVSVNHEFFEGDRVATGKNSKAKIEFDGGRTVEIGENSQIQITAIQSENNLSFIVTLLKGSLSAKATKSEKKVGEFTVKAGEKHFVLASKQDEVGIFKSNANDKVSVFTLKQDGKTIVNSPKPITEPEPELTPEPLKVEEKEVKVAEAPKKIEVTAPKKQDVTGYECKITNISNGDIFWTEKSLKGDLVEMRLPVEVASPKNSEPLGKWAPLLEISPTGSGSDANAVVMAGAEKYQSQRIFLLLDKVRTSVKQNVSDLGPELTFNLRSGAKLSDVKGINRSFVQEARKVSLRSFNDVSDGAISILSSGFNSQMSDIEWIKENKNLSGTSAPYRLDLLSKKDLSSVIPIIRRSSGLRLSRENTTFDNKGIYIVRGQQVVAELGGQKTWPADIVKKLMLFLGADFVFEGMGNAILNIKGKSSEEIFTMMNQVEGNRYIYIFDGKKMQPVNRQFVESSPEVVKFLGSNAVAIFKDSVKLKAIKGGE